MYSKMKIFGHPIHPMLIAYPVAFNTATLVGFIGFAATQDALWLKFAIACNIAAVASAVVAALPGSIDWLVGIPSGTEAKRTGMIHSMLNVGSLALFAVTLAIYAGEWNNAGVSATLGVVLPAIAVGLTILGGFQGWKLVQDHHVGVRLTPEQEKIERDSIERETGAYRRAG